MPRAMLGDVEIDAVTREAPEYASEVTDKPVERGANISDHVRPQAIICRLTGVFAGPTAQARLDRLLQYWQNAERMLYVGRNVYRGLVITEFGTQHGAETADGFIFDISLRQLQTTTAIPVTVAAPDMAGQANQAGNHGLQLPGTVDADQGQRASFLRQVLDSARAYLARVGSSATIEPPEDEQP